MRTRLVILALAALGLYALVSPLVAKSGNNPKTHGPYEVVFKGEYDGVGKAVVAAKKVVHIKGDVTDTSSGQTGKFNVGQMPLSDDGHFSGTGTFSDSKGNKVDITIVGRVEVPDANLIKKARIICTFTTSNGEAGRILGSK